MISYACVSISLPIRLEGLGMKSTAPYLSVSKVTEVPSWVSVLSMTVGVGHWIIICLRVDKPSITGMLISRVTTSGLCCLISSRASLPLVASPMISRLVSDDSILSSPLRIMAESSTMRTLQRRSDDFSAGVSIFPSVTGGVRWSDCRISCFEEPGCFCVCFPTGVFLGIVPPAWAISSSRKSFCLFAWVDSVDFFFADV